MVAENPFLGNIARKVSFGSTGRFVKQNLSDEEVQEQRLLKWALQAEARYILPDERVAHCLRQVNPMAACVEVLHSPEHRVAHYKSLIICGSVWMCPLCAAKISERRREELERAISRHIDQNGAVFMATYTIAHSRFDDLSRLLQAFLRAKKRIKQGEYAQRRKRVFGIVGTISVLEVTWSTLNHWHPHSHELIFTMQPINTMNERAYEADVRVAWERAAAREDLHMNEHGYKLDKTFGAVADYVAKFGHEPLGKPWGVESEMTKGHLKRGRGPVEHLTPFGLLYHINQGNEELIPVFRDYARWFKGKHQLNWSSGLRALLLGSEEEQTDEQLAAAVMEEAVLLGLLTRAQWRVVLANDARGELLEVARSGEWELVKDFLVSIGCVLSTSDPIQGA
jgi:replication protein